MYACGRTYTTGKIFTKYIINLQTKPFMMTSSNENIFRVTGPLCKEFTDHRWIPAQRPVTRKFDVFFDLRLNKRLSKQSWGWWFEMPSRPLWRHCNVKKNATNFWCISSTKLHSVRVYMHAIFHIYGKYLHTVGHCNMCYTLYHSGKKSIRLYF